MVLLARLTMTRAEEENDSDVLLREVQSLVNEQFDLTVSFCNAQTSLLNAAASQDDNDNARRQEILLDEYSASLRKVQDHWVKLQDANEKLAAIPAYRRVSTVYKAHTERTERILLTVQRSGGGVWTPNGISLSPNDSDTVTVALATLRASVDSVRDVVSLHVRKE